MYKNNFSKMEIQRSSFSGIPPTFSQFYSTGIACICMGLDIGFVEMNLTSGLLSHMSKLSSSLKRHRIGEKTNLDET